MTKQSIKTIKMKTEKLGQEPAFPVEVQSINYNIDGYIPNICHGMSKRLYLAGMAMQGILGSLTSESAYVVFMRMSEMDRNETGKHAIIRTALNVADELLKQEAE